MGILKKRVLLIVCVCIFSFSNSIFAAEYETITFEEEGKSYIVSVKYPKITSELLQEVNAAIKSFVYGLFEEDLKFFIDEKDIKEELELEFSSNIVTIDFDVIRLDENFISLRIEKYFNGIGAMHGYTCIYGFNYDIENSKIIELKDIFKPGINYEKQISKYCIEDLCKQLNVGDDLWIKSGASADKENFKDFAISKNSLIFYFSDYKVACYAAGTQRVEMPFSELSEMDERALFN
jgi:hypothetical protein